MARLFLLAALDGCTYPTRADFQARSTRAPIEAAVVFNEAGEIDVRGVDGREARAEIWLQYERRHPVVRWEVDGDTLFLTVGCDSNFPTCDALVELEIPRDVDLTATALAGNLSVNDIEGDVQAGSPDGDIFLSAVSGHVEATSTRGDIVGAGLQGRSVLAETSDGAIHVVHTNSFDLLLTTTVLGRIHLLVPGGRYDVDTRSAQGEINVEGIRRDEEAGSRIVARSVEGDVDIVGYAVTDD